VNWRFHRRELNFTKCKIRYGKIFKFFRNELRMQFISRRVLLFNSRELNSLFTQTHKRLQFTLLYCIGNMNFARSKHKKRPVSKLTGRHITAVPPVSRRNIPRLILRCNARNASSTTRSTRSPTRLQSEKENFCRIHTFQPRVRSLSIGR